MRGVIQQPGLQPARRLVGRRRCDKAAAIGVLAQRTAAVAK